MGCIGSPENSHVEALNPQYLKHVSVFGQKDLKEVIKVQSVCTGGP